MRTLSYSPFVEGQRESAPTGTISAACPQCGAAVRFNATSGSLVCDHCGVHTKAPTGPLVTDFDLESRALQAGSLGLGLQAERRIECGECGAAVVFAGASITDFCDFCGSHAVLPKAAHRQLIRPASLVPFVIDRARAVAAFEAWRNKRWLAPRALRKGAALDKLVGVYIPVWLFSTTVDSKWHAQAGEKSFDGDTLHWTDETGWRSDDYRDILVRASSGLDQGMLEQLGEFELNQLVAYDPDYLAGWHAEEYERPLNDAWAEAAWRIRGQQYHRCMYDVPAQHVRNVTVQDSFHQPRFQHALLPVWIAVYRHRGKPYRFMLNGQTGRATGKAPLSPGKIVGVPALVLLAGIVAWLLMGRPVPAPETQRALGWLALLFPVAIVAAATRK